MKLKLILIFQFRESLLCSSTFIGENVGAYVRAYELKTLQEFTNEAKLLAIAQSLDKTLTDVFQKDHK